MINYHDFSILRNMPYRGISKNVYRISVSVRYLHAAHLAAWLSILLGRIGGVADKGNTIWDEKKGRAVNGAV